MTYYSLERFGPGSLQMKDNWYAYAKFRKKKFVLFYNKLFINN